MCRIDWALLLAGIGAFSTLGLLVAAVFGYGTWKSQFLKTRDHDLARRLLQAVSNSGIVFDELRTPQPLFSDGDESVADNPADDLMRHGLDRRRMNARYRARGQRVAAVMSQRTELLLEAMALWDDNESYVLRLEELIISLAGPERAVLEEARKVVELWRPGNLEHIDVNTDVLFKPLDGEAEDKVHANYQTILDDIREHLKSKVRME